MAATRVVNMTRPSPAKPALESVDNKGADPAAAALLAFPVGFGLAVAREAIKVASEAKSGVAVKLPPTLGGAVMEAEGGPVARGASVAVLVTDTADVLGD